MAMASATLNRSLLGSSLSERHYADLGRSGIDRATADRALLRSVTNIEGAEILGRRTVKSCSGILFSNVFPGDTHVRQHCIRVDSPELELQTDGSQKEIRKYLVPAQSRPLLWFMPGVPIEQLADPSLPVVFLEGLKKYVAADRLAYYEVENGRPRFLAIGIPGAWNWRGTVAIRTGANGNREPIKGPIPDLARIVWVGRTVYLIFDADIHTNEQVRWSRRSLALELQKRGANVLAVDLPAEGLKEGVKGFDDFLATHGPEAALRLIETARKPSVPPHFRLTETAVEYIHSTDDKSILVCSRLEVTAQTRDENGNSWGRLLTWTDADQNRHQWAMPMSMLAGEGAEFRSHLLSGGLLLGTMRLARELLPEYIHRAAPERKILCVSRIGWHGPDSFVLPDGTIGPIDRPEVLFQSETLLKHDYRQSGSLSEWIEQVGNLCAGNSRLVLSVSIAFAASLLSILQEESGGFHLRGSSSTGKTSALIVAGSVWGGGKNGFVKTWKSTAAGLEVMAQHHNDALLPLDELGQVDSRDAGEICYQLANGQGKIRSNRSIQLREVPTWNLLFLSSGELSLMQHMQTAGKRARGGQNVRLIEIPADAGKDRGIFENIHGFADPAAFAVHLTRAAKEYFGKPIREFLREVCNSVDDVRETVRAAQAAFVKATVQENSSGEVHRAGRRFGLVAGAGELATALDFTGWKRGEAIRATTDCFNAWLKDRGGIAGFDEIAAVSHVRSLLATGLTSRFQRGRDERVMNQLGYVETRDDEVTEYRFLPEIFRNEICRGFDYEAVAKTLIKRGFMVSEEDHSTAKRTIPGIGRKRVYVVLSTIFED
jgi:uncharacterized protein (DUF927 family)